MPSPPQISFGFGDWLIKQINSWFAHLAASAIKPLLDALAVTLLATPDVSSSGRVFDLWKVTAIMADSAFLLLATIGAVIAMGHQTVQTRYAVKEVLPRLAMAMLASNMSFPICGKLIQLANGVSTALLGQDFDAERATTQLRQLILPPSNSQIFYILLELVAIVLLILLLVSFVMRSALVLLLVVAAPLALACHALPHTDGVARFWWRAFTGLLVIQVAQSLKLVVAVRVFFNQDGRFLLGLAPTGQLVNLVLALCLLIILVRIPSWIQRRIFVQGNRSMILRIFKYAVVSKLTMPVLKAMHLGKGGSGGGKGRVGKAATRAVAGKVIAGTIGGPAGTAAATTAVAVRGAQTAKSSRVAQQGAARANASTAPGRQPRRQSPARPWTPPDPQARINRGASWTPEAYYRWSDPARRWTPPGTSTPAAPGAIPSTARPIRTSSPLANSTVWVPLDTRPAPPAQAHVPGTPASATSRDHRARQRGSRRTSRGGEER
ncbi:conjugal transfer protein TrbL family protein [Nonomuraea basaltis]|uniref:conjugal transfer protein TrbL family protein n=1 Tax=Nonomuraea basaltis TaxID=2495887 RepID=UPI00110C4E90|nr:conjugal transfer protein TrbL family protein [Nonomuraea basaltis]TMR96804.1 hypothetical protein EJK15_21095 [Nonomuraea basaltis]